MTKKKVTYPRSEVLKVLRTLSEIVVSLDRIGSASVGIPQGRANAQLWEFVKKHKVARKLANARAALSEPFSQEIGSDDMDELEREMQNIPYWSSKKT